MKRLVLLVGSIGLSSASSALAQGFNIDVNSAFGTPSAAFGAGGNQAGTWNAVDGIAGTYPLLDLAGAASSASITCVGVASYNFSFNNAGTSGDDEMLMDDASDPTSAGAIWTISGVAPGNYVLYTYAWAPDSAAYQSLVDVSGSPDPAQTVGGAWIGTYVSGLTHAEHHVTVAPGGSVGMTITVALTFATLNGFQLVPESGATLHCDPGVGGVLACPCANPPSGASRGCDNSASTGGASNSPSGSPVLANDTLVFTTAGEKPTATSILLQGTALIANGLVFGQGVRCVGGTLKRIYIATASGGSISVPQPGWPSISFRSATLGDVIAPASTRYYLVYYRDPIVLGGCSATSTFNATNTVEILWQ